jgi:hypothetical protein
MGALGIAPDAGTTLGLASTDGANAEGFVPAAGTITLPGGGDDAGMLFEDGKFGAFDWYGEYVG